MRWTSVLCITAAGSAVIDDVVPLYKVPDAPIPARVADLLSRMTLQEKLNQMALPFGADYPADYIQYNTTGLGATYPLSGGVDARNQWQRWQVENSRLGIPTSFIAETLHSGASHGTIYPMPALQGCTWDVALVRDVAAGIALEAAAARVDRGFSPVLHFCTDPRFGRCEESFGEDPMLVAKLGAAAVTGLSGPGAAGAANTYLADPYHKIAAVTAPCPLRYRKTHCTTCISSHGTTTRRRAAVPLWRRTTR